jgi:hypothetical protein
VLAGPKAGSLGIAATTRHLNRQRRDVGMIASLPSTTPPARRGNEDQNRLGCVVGWAKIGNTMDGESQTPGMIAPSLSLGHISFPSCVYGLMFITVGMVLLLYEEEETRKVWLHHGRGGWLVWRCYTWLVSLSSLLFYDHVFYSTHPPRHVLHALHACTCTLLSWWLFPFYFFIAFYFGGWHVDMVGYYGQFQETVGRWECIERDGGTGDSGGFLVYIHCTVQ